MLWPEARDADKPSIAERKTQSFNTAPTEVRLRTGTAFDAQQRTAPRSSPAPVAAPSITPSDSAVPSAGSVCLQYKEPSPIRVRGMATGRVYEFSGAQPVGTVDERDALALLQTRLFLRA